MHNLTGILTIALASTATAIPVANECALARDSCHTDCAILRNNLNICLCTATPRSPEQSCKDAQDAYTDCAMKKCVLPAQRRFEEVGDKPRWIVVGGDVVANDEDEENKGKLTRREKKCWKFMNQSWFCKDV